MKTGIMRKISIIGRFLGLLCLALPLRSAETNSLNDFAEVQRLFDKHCVECHEAKDPEGKLVLESFESLMQGGENGPSIVPKKSQESLLVKRVEGRVEREGKKKIMPPGKKTKLTAEETATIKSWIDAGALPPKE